MRVIEKYFLGKNEIIWNDKNFKYCIKCYWCVEKNKIGVYYSIILFC